MKLLLDTCTFLWLVNGSRELSPRAAALCRASDNEVYVSAASGWEIVIKYAAGRLKLDTPPAEFVPAQREAHGMAALAIDEESALQVSRLPPLHRDPFDRILVAQAIIHGLTILTPDPLVTQYPARTMW